MYTMLKCVLKASHALQIAIGLSSGTHGRIAPRSEIALKDFLKVNAEVIDQDYTGEIKGVLINLSTENYKVHKGAKITELIGGGISSDEAILVEKLEKTERGEK